MNCRVRTKGKDSTVEPLRCRIVCDLRAAAEKLGTDGILPWTDDGKAILAFTEDEEAEIVAALGGAGIPYTLEAKPQPDAELLAKLRGRVTTRTEALAYLAKHWISCEPKEAQTAGLEYNRTAKGIVAYSDSERDEIVQRLIAAGGTPQVVVAKRPPPTAEELDQRLKEVEAKEIRTPETG